jgi:hypothetical protein
MTRTRLHHHRKRTNWKPAFLAALAETGLVNQAAKTAGITPATAHHARDLKNRTGPNLAEAQRFAQAWEDALQSVADHIESEIFRRAIEGVDLPHDVYYKGEKVGTQMIRTYSDRLLIFLAKAYRPDRFGRHWGLPGQPESAPLPEEEPFDILKETQELAQKRWDELRPLVAHRLAVMELARKDAQTNDTPSSPDQYPTNQFPPESETP